MSPGTTGQSTDVSSKNMKMSTLDISITCFSTTCDDLNNEFE